MKFPLKDISGKILKQATISDDVYGVEPNHDLIHQAIVYYQANQRQGTHNTLTRGQVSGGGRKPFAQKHTGRARAGTIRAAQWRGGGAVFGPHPRSYRKKLPIKMRRQAIRCALSSKANQERLVLVDSIKLDNAKTKTMIQVLESLNVRSSALIVLRQIDTQVVDAVRNIPKTKTLAVDLLNVLDLARYDVIIMTEDAAKRTEELWAGREVRRRGAAI